LYTSDTRDFAVSRPGMLQCRWNLRGFYFGDAEVPENVEPTLFEPQFFQDVVQAMFQNIPLHQLAAVRFTENQTTRSAAHELTQHRGQGLGQIRQPPVPGIRVLRFHLVLKLSALGFLHNLQCAEVFIDGTNVEAECFPARIGPQPASNAYNMRYGSLASCRIAVISPRSTVGCFCSSTSGTSMNSSS
jgi:hypothetical protein